MIRFEFSKDTVCWINCVMLLAIMILLILALLKLNKKEKFRITDTTCPTCTATDCAKNYPTLCKKP